MARTLFQTLLRHCANHRPHFFPAKSPPSILLSVRHRHRNSKAELIVIDLTSSSSSSSPSPSSSSDGEGELLVMERLEDIFHRVTLQKSAPDWLPFIPGSSFWVPPNKRPIPSIGEVFNKMANTLTEEESLSLTNSRGWPSSSFFTRQEQEVAAPVKFNMEVRIVEGKDLSMEVNAPEEEGESDEEMGAQVFADSNSDSENKQT